MDTQQVKQLTDNDAYLRSKLFCRGFLLTKCRVDTRQYPFYGMWNTTAVGAYTLISHPQQHVFIKTCGDVTVGIIGHAYNPFSGEVNENVILDRLLPLCNNKKAFFEAVNELTGVFALFCVQQDVLWLLNDAVSLQCVYYTEDAQQFYAASHVNLIGDLAGLQEDAFITRLKSCRTFYYFGNQLPGNLSKFREVRLVLPNHYLEVKEKAELVRFYTPHDRDMEMEEIVSAVSDFMQKTMRLLPEKWKRPAISLTGGCDSKTTLAGACEVYPQYKFFSYDSQPNELPDAEAAGVICKAIGQPHTLYRIPYEDSAFDNIEGVRLILNWNGGDIRANNPNDVRKRAFLDKINDFDVEVKSWASEIGRARYSKRYKGKQSFGKSPSPRKCTSFYKFLTNRKIVNETDRVFRAHIDRYFQADRQRPIPWQDQWYWEWHWPTRDGITLTCEHMFSDAITVPYNNRKLLEVLLSAPFQDRYEDSVYTAVRERLDKRIDAACEGIVDVNHTQNRAFKELAYYYMNTLLPY